MKIEFDKLALILSFLAVVIFVGAVATYNINRTNKGADLAMKNIDANTIVCVLDGYQTQCALAMQLTKKGE